MNGAGSDSPIDTTAGLTASALRRQWKYTAWEGLSDLFCSLPVSGSCNWQCQNSAARMQCLQLQNAGSWHHYAQEPFPFAASFLMTRVRHSSLSGHALGSLLCISSCVHTWKLQKASINRVAWFAVSLEHLLTLYLVLMDTADQICTNSNKDYSGGSLTSKRLSSWHSGCLNYIWTKPLIKSWQCQKLKASAAIDAALFPLILLKYLLQRAVHPSHYITLVCKDKGRWGNKAIRQYVVRHIFLASFAVLCFFAFLLLKCFQA